jgi:hypothetical protein
VSIFPLEFMPRLAALVPRPRLQLIRFHGVLAPNAKLRALAVPQEMQQEPEPPSKQSPLSARRTARATARCGDVPFVVEG